MKKFDHIKAASYEEASRIIKEKGGAAEPIAGGTDLLGTYRDRLLSTYPEAVVSLQSIPDTAYIEDGGDEIIVGAGTKLKDIAASDLVKEGCNALSEAAHSVASPLIRSTATIGGNICQDVRCWYYRYPNSIGGRLECKRKGGDTCYAICGENRYHSIFGGMCHGASSCQHACPAGTDIPEYMAKIREGDWDGAAQVFFRYNPMPMMTSRICPHPCTDSCNQNVYGESVNIPAVERTLGDYILEHQEKFYTAPSVSTGKRCAVIGAGPGGLTAAFYLRRAGHEVTVYDAHEKAGGVLRYGIPHYRLPKSIVDDFCNALESGMGISFVMNTKVGQDITVEDIKSKNDLVYFGTGAWSQPVLGLEGEKLTEFGLDFLSEVNTYLQKAIGENVLVCGGGNVAMDVALTAKRLGAKTVKLVCLEQRNEMPASDDEVEMAVEEGIQLYNGWGLGKVLADAKGKVGGLEAKRCLSVFDENGRFSPIYDEKDVMTLSSDFIILATGQRVDISFLGEKLTSQLKTARGLIDADLESGKTKTDGYYAGGDAVTGPDLAIRAIQAGRIAAYSMNRDLGVSEDAAHEAEKYTHFDVAGIENTKQSKLYEKPASERSLAEEDRASLDQDAAKGEAERCLHCACYAVNASDITPVLVMADAKIITTERTLTAKELFTAQLTVQDALHQGELVKELRIPKQHGENHYIKRRVRDAIDFAIVAIAGNLKVSGGVIEDANIVLGGVAPVPYEMQEISQFLKGKKISAELAEEAGEIAMKDAAPMGKNEYKVFMCRDALFNFIMDAAR
ncbi:MAG: FAD binding domain-containing protein [Bacillota bacterium]|nr:FAD binding domain-containing protein [Bacillota bacterium]